jgi:hypothetical protein
MGPLNLSEGKWVYLVYTCRNTEPFFSEDFLQIRGGARRCLWVLRPLNISQGWCRGDEIPSFWDSAPRSFNLMPLGLEVKPKTWRNITTWRYQGNSHSARVPTCRMTKKVDLTLIWRKSSASYHLNLDMLFTINISSHVYVYNKVFVLKTAILSFTIVLLWPRDQRNKARLLRASYFKWLRAKSAWL